MHILRSQKRKDPYEPLRMAIRPSDSNHPAPGRSLDLHYLHCCPKYKAQNPLAPDKPSVAAALHICYIIPDAMDQNPFSSADARFAAAAFPDRSEGAAGTLPGDADESLPVCSAWPIHAGGAAGKNEI